MFKTEYEVLLERELQLSKGWEKIAHTNGEQKREYLGKLIHIGVMYFERFPDGVRGADYDEMMYFIEEVKCVIENI